MNVSPLHARTLSLLEQLPWKHHCIYMDNLYISANLLLLVFTLLTHMCAGVCWKGGRGVPHKMKQEEKTKQEEAYLNRGTLKASVLHGVPNMTTIVCTSLYDVKPFYMMSSICKKVVWVKKFMEVFNKYSIKKILVPFYRLALADDCNEKMGKVDIGVQLHHYYRFTTG